MLARRYVSVVVAATAVVHLLSSGALWLLLGERARWPERMTDIRKLPVEDRATIAEEYLLTRWSQTDKPKVLVLGDSQMRSHQLAPSLTWSLELQRLLPEYDVINAAITDGRLTDAVKLLTILKKHNLRPSVVLQNIDLSHFREDTAPDAGHLGEGRAWLANLPPIGARAVTAFTANLDDIQSLLRGDIIPHWRTASPAPAFKLRDLPPTQFAVFEVERFEPVLASFVGHALAVTSRVLIFAAPLDRTVFAHYGWSDESIRKDEQRLLERFNHPGIDIIDIAPPLEHDDFFDVVHLSPAGGNHLASRLAPLIRRPPNR